MSIWSLVEEGSGFVAAGLEIWCLLGLMIDTRIVIAMNLIVP